MTLAAPGSTLWLLGHELRLGLRGIMRRGGSGGGLGVRGWIRWGLLGLVAVAVGGVIGLPMAMAAHRLHFHPIGPFYLAVDAAALVMFTLMLAQSLNAATVALYERNDLDLLLSSPLPAQRVLTVRGLGIAVLSSLLYLLLTSLLVLPLAALGEVRWLGALVVVAGLGLLSAAAGLLLAMGLFAVLGARRTRLAAQVLAAVIGAAVFLISQARNLLPKAELARLTRRITGLGGVGVDPASPTAWLGRAAAGDPLPLLLFALASLGAFLLVARLLGRRFGDNAAAAAGATGASPRAAARAQAGAAKVSFQGGPFAALVRKERRLLTRDPWLISQVLLQIVYILPMSFVIARNGLSHTAIAIAGGAAAATFICGQLAGNLTWITVSAEDSPELLATAPVSAWTALRAKLVVALAPVLVLACLPIGVIAVVSPASAPIAAAGCLGAAVSAGLINLWWSKPGQRRDFRRRRQGSVLVGLVEVFMLFAWGGATWMGVSGLGLWTAIPVAVALCLLAVMRRPVRLSAPG